MKFVFRLLPCGVVLDLLHERHREAFGQAAVDLAFDDHRVDDDAAVVHREESPHLHSPGLAIDVDHRDVGRRSG